MESNERKSLLKLVPALLLLLGAGITMLSIPFSVAAQAEQSAVPEPAAKPTVQAEAGQKTQSSQAVKETVSGTAAKKAALSEAIAQTPAAPTGEKEKQVRGERIRIGSSQIINAEENVREFITVFGNSELAGEAERDMVTVFGNAKMTGKVGGDMVTVFGDAQVNGSVDRDLVVVFGNLNLGPKAVVNHDCVVVFGKLNRDTHSILERQALEIMPWFSSLGNYIRSGPLLGRLLPPKSGLAWIVVALHFVVYILIAIILPKPTAAGVKRLDDNPFLSLGVGVLIMILFAPVMFILVATGIGIILVPFVGLADLAFAALGKASILEFIGLQIMRRFRSDADSYPIFGFLIGFVIVTVIYMIPILGLLVWIILRPLALGAAVLAVFGTIRRNGNGSSAPGIPVYSAPGNTSPTVTPPSVNPDSAANSTSQGNMPLAASGVASDSGMMVMPRAGFWIRTAATLLDFVLLVWLLFFTHKFFLLFWLAYHIAMWTWKGTTIGGIICSLKVVRADGRPIDFGVSLVRGLTAVFSAVVLCLGFFWAGWTRTRQSWHDMIADTVIVRVPRAISLI
jgi:uncharacterized RDD family membrane protein YckC